MQQQEYSYLYYEDDVSLYGKISNHMDTPANVLFSSLLSLFLFTTLRSCVLGSASDIFSYLTKLYKGHSFISESFAVEDGDYS